MTFLVELRSYPRVQPYDLGIQIDITCGFLFRQGTVKDGIMRGAKIDKILLEEDSGPFSAPDGRSRQSKTGILQETAVRTLWDYSRALKASNLDRKHRTCKILLG